MYDAARLTGTVSFIGNRRLNNRINPRPSSDVNRPELELFSNKPPQMAGILTDNGRSWEIASEVKSEFKFFLLAIGFLYSY